MESRQLGRGFFTGGLARNCLQQAVDFNFIGNNRRFDRNKTFLFFCQITVSLRNFLTSLAIL